MTQTHRQEMINYSPLPRSSYRWTSGGHSYGPATSALLDTQETWNLAYLSHDYTSGRDHPDPQFTSHVRRTAQSRLDGTGADLTDSCSIEVVASLLRLPAPRFAYLIRKHPALPSLPMFKVYGQPWLDLIDQRSRLCSVDGYTHRTPLHEEAQALADQVSAIIAKARLQT